MKVLLLEGDVESNPGPQNCPVMSSVLSCHITPNVTRTVSPCHPHFHAMPSVLSYHVIRTVMPCHLHCHVIRAVMPCHPYCNTMSCVLSCHVIRTVMPYHLYCHPYCHVISSVLPCHPLCHVIRSVISCHPYCHAMSSCLSAVQVSDSTELTHHAELFVRTNNICDNIGAYYLGLSFTRTLCDCVVCCVLCVARRVQLPNT